MKFHRILIPVILGLSLIILFLGGIANGYSAQAPLAINIIYVDDDNVSGTANGVSWTTAYTNVQDALAAAVSGNEIWVAQGVYYPDEGLGQINDDYYSHFELKNGVALYGGFDPDFGVVDFIDRDWEVYPTVLSGDLGQNDTTDANGVVTTTESIVNWNALQVVYGIGVTETVVLDGFTVTAGQAYGFSNKNGGGIYISGGSPILSHLFISGNLANSHGAGIYTENSQAKLTDITVSGNLCHSFGGGMSNVNSSPIMSDVILINNTGGFGGGMSNEGGDVVLSQVEILNNRAEYGGGMYNYEGTLSMTNAILVGNYAGSWGGGIYNGYSDSGTFTNLTIASNSADEGGGVFNNTSNPDFLNSILWENTAVSSGHEVENWNGGVPVFENSLIKGSGGSASWDTSLGIDGGSNIDADPLNVYDPDSGDGDWSTPGDNDYGDLRLRTGSPAIDSGANTGCPSIDLDGNPRPVGFSCDMGAYETTSGFFVDHEAPGPTHDGLTWTTAFVTVQDALADADSGDQIWVAMGVYYPDEGDGQSDDDINSRFELKENVALYGGFDPSSGADTFSERNWVAYPTVLSGDRTQNDTTDLYGVVTTTANIHGTNVYHVIWGVNVTETAVLDGFTITAGQANDVTDPHTRGGGIYIFGGSPTLRHLILSGNFAKDRGGGMSNDQSSISLEDVTFSGNSSGSFGGGMANWQSNNSLVEVTFLENSASDQGGGVFNYYGSLALSEVKIIGNSADYGGGMMNTGTNITITNAILVGNSATLQGGGMWNYLEQPRFTNLTVADNTADDGGGLYNHSSSPQLTNVIFWGNTADVQGNQILNMNSSTPVISYSDIQGSGGSTSWDTALGTDGGSNIDSNPIFVLDPDPGDGDWTTLADNDYGNMRLTSGSPAINNGTNTGCPLIDLDGNPRPIGASCDMGAYEFRVILFLPLMMR
jgi:hypothetical protein